MPHASTSLAAFHSLSVASLRDRIEEIVEGYGEEGCISDDLLSHFPTEDRQSSSAITGRYSELEREGRIFRAGDTRAGRTGRQQKVLRHSKYAVVVPLKITAPKKKSGFLAGLIFAAKIVVKSSDLTGAKSALGKEIKKALTR